MNWRDSATPALASNWLRARTPINAADDHMITPPPQSTISRCQKKVPAAPRANTQVLAIQRRETQVKVDINMRGRAERSSVPGLAAEPLSTMHCLPSPWSWCPTATGETAVAFAADEVWNNKWWKDEARQKKNAFSRGKSEEVETAEKGQGSSVSLP